MKAIFVLLALWISLPLQAATVVIDFENVVPPGENKYGDEFLPYVENGIRFEGPSDPAGMDIAVFGARDGAPSATLNFCNGLVLIGCENLGQTLTFASELGEDFALESLQAEWWHAHPTPPLYYEGEFIITGYYSSGGSITRNLGTEMNTELSTFIFDAGWTDLETVELTGWCNDSTPDFDTACNHVRMDNIAISIVPIPAAVWLFASGLASLSFVRRRS